MADTGRVLIKAAIARLNAVSGVTDLVGSRIYTDAPQPVTYPFILVENSSRPFAAKDFSEQRHALRVHCYSRQQSISECMEVREEVFAALDRAESSLSLDAGTLVMIQFSGTADAFKEQDGRTWHSVIEFDTIIGQ